MHSRHFIVCSGRYKHGPRSNLDLGLRSDSAVFHLHFSYDFGEFMKQSLSLNFNISKRGTKIPTLIPTVRRKKDTDRYEGR